MGFSNKAYWLSWFITGLILNVVTSFLIIVSCYALQFELFTDTPFVVMFALFVFFGISLLGLAFVISTACSTLTSATTAAYTILLLCFLMEIFMTNPFLTLTTYVKEVPDWFIYARFLLEFIPTYSFSIIFVSIGNHAGRHMNYRTGIWE